MTEICGEVSDFGDGTAAVVLASAWIGEDLGSGSLGAMGGVLALFVGY